MSHEQLHNLICGRWVDRCIVAFAFLAWGSTALQLARGLSNIEPQIQFVVFILGSFSLAILVRSAGHNHAGFISIHRQYRNGILGSMGEAI